MKSPRSFGSTLRAVRLGWQWSECHAAFIRMSDLRDDKSLVELCPGYCVPNYATPSKEHRRWWDDPGILDSLPWLRNVRRVKKYIAVIVNDDGDIVATWTPPKRKPENIRNIGPDSMRIG